MHIEINLPFIFLLIKFLCDLKLILLLIIHIKILMLVIMIKLFKQI